MKPAPFDLVIAKTVDEALDHLRRAKGVAKVMAGGQSLMPMLNMRLANPEVVIDISRISELTYIRREPDYLEVGAATTQYDLLYWPNLTETVPLLKLAMPHIGHFQTRNRGTVCGSICHADPSSELPLSLATLGGKVVLRRKRRTRVLSASEFQTGMLSNACDPDEIVVAVRFPVKRDGERFAFQEIARRHGDFAVVALAAVGLRGVARLGVGGLADKPAVREFKSAQGDDFESALNDFAWELRGSDDIHATARYRREIVRRIGKRIIQEVLDGAAS